MACAEAHAEIGDSYFRRANRFYREGRWEEAIARYEQTLRINPEHVGAQYNLALTYQTQQRFGLAMRAFEKAKRMDPAFIQTYVSHGLLYAQMGRMREAQLEYRRALRVRPDNYLARLNLAALFAKQGEHARAFHMLGSVLAVDGGDLRAHLLRAGIFLKRESYVAAGWEYAKVLRLEPNLPAVRIGLALCMGHMGHYEAALRQAWVAQRDGASASDYARGTAKINTLRYRRTGEKWEHALRAWRDAVRYSEDDPEGYTQMGNLLSEAGKKKQAARWYRRVLDSPTAPMDMRLAVEERLRS